MGLFKFLYWLFYIFPIILAFIFTWPVSDGQSIIFHFYPMSGITILPFSSLVIWINLLLSKILYNLNVENYKDYIKYFIFSPLLTNIFIIIFPVLGFDNKIWLTTILINLLLIAIFSLIYILLYLRGLKQYIGGTLFTIYIMLFVFFSHLYLWTTS